MNTIDNNTEITEIDNDDDDDDEQDGTCSKSGSKDSLNDEDIIDFPLPDIPVKQDLHNNNANLTNSENIEEPINEENPKKDEIDEEGNTEKMHYRNANDKPTYLFGENLKKNEIFLNKSGWVQVSSQVPLDENSRLTKGSRKFLECEENRLNRSSKIEDFINRNDARRNNGHKIQRQDNVTILTIDPQMSGSSRPACLPIKRNISDNSPPPVTPILSPPPAFQDSKYKHRLLESKKGSSVYLTVANNENKSPKGMVFSRSFEYDNRRYTDYKEPFSKSFDYDFSPTITKTSPVQDSFLRLNRNKSPVFHTLTGNSPNYLTKKEKPKESPIFPKTIPGNSLHPVMANYASVNSDTNKKLENRSRRSQFTKQTSSPVHNFGYRNNDLTVTSGQRLNSCDSGARSGKFYLIVNGLIVFVMT